MEIERDRDNISLKYTDSREGISIINGNGYVYYHSGKVCIRISKINEYLSKYYCFANDNKHSLLGIINEKGNGYVSSKPGIIRLNRTRKNELLISKL